MKDLQSKEKLNEKNQKVNFQIQHAATVKFADERPIQNLRSATRKLFVEKLKTLHDRKMSWLESEDGKVKAARKKEQERQEMIEKAKERVK